MGLSECPPLESDDLELPCAAEDAPAPAGPCAPARSAPTVEKSETLRTRTATTKIDLFIVNSSVEDLQTKLGEAVSPPSRPQQCTRSCFDGGVLLQSVKLAGRTGRLVCSEFRLRYCRAGPAHRSAARHRLTPRRHAD